MESLHRITTEYAIDLFLCSLRRLDIISVDKSFPVLGAGGGQGIDFEVSVTVVLFTTIFLVNESTHLAANVHGPSDRDSALTV